MAALSGRDSDTGSLPTCTSGDIGIFKDKVLSIENKVTVLERRIIGDGVSIGVYSFQSFEDCRIWAKTHMPNNRYGLFVDVISLFELFHLDQVANSETIGSLLQF
mmetsp:Transcript_6065/g.8862  ORF Transcript_6065/g.8862 Transcript_6065/m.8862 type:complete len:105 (+) Transcript_6065:1206-1520(+)